MAFCAKSALPGARVASAAGARQRRCGAAGRMRRGPALRRSLPPGLMADKALGCLATIPTRQPRQWRGVAPS